MTESAFQESRDVAKEEMIQHLFEHMSSLMRQIHRDVNFVEPLLSPTQARLLFVVSRYKEEGISVKDLARLINVTPGAVTQFIDILIAKNLVIREEDPEDRRSVKLKTTPSAKAQMEKFRQDFFRAAARKFNVLSIDELKLLNSLMAKVSPLTFDNASENNDSGQHLHF